MGLGNWGGALNNFLDLTGEKFGRLTVLFPVGRNLRTTKALWLCKCTCGGEKLATSGVLRACALQSCGCLQREAMEAHRTHGHAPASGASRTYRSWWAMLQRSYFGNAASAADYKGRGITVCPQWRYFEAFLADLGPCPPGLTLGRIDNDAGYFPSNVRWESRAQQARNKRSSRFLTFNKETKNLCDFAAEYHLSVSTLWSRLKRGWPVERALTQPVKQQDPGPVKPRLVVVKGQP